MRLIALLLLPVFAASTAVAQEREWTIDRTDEDAFLIFGTPGTDDVGISLWCKLGGNRVRIQMADAGHEGKTSRGVFAVEIGAQHFTLPASLSRNSDDKILAETEVNLNGKVLAALAQANQLSMSLNGHVTSFPFDADKVSELRKACQIDGTAP